MEYTCEKTLQFQSISKHCIIYQIRSSIIARILFIIIIIIDDDDDYKFACQKKSIIFCYCYVLFWANNNVYYTMMMIHEQYWNKAKQKKKNPCEGWKKNKKIPATIPFEAAVVFVKPKKNLINGIRVQIK